MAALQVSEDWRSVLDPLERIMDKVELAFNAVKHVTLAEGECHGRSTNLLPLRYPPPPRNKDLRRPLIRETNG